MKQINVLAGNKVGVLADISFILGKARINIESISIAVAGEKALISLAIKDVGRAKQLLEANHYKVLESDILVVRLLDRPGELAKVSKILSDAGISILTASIMSRGGGFGLMALGTDNNRKSERLLVDYLKAE